MELNVFLIIFWLMCVSITVYFHVQSIREKEASSFKPLIHASYLCVYGCFAIAAFLYYMGIAESASFDQQIENIRRSYK